MRKSFSLPIRWTQWIVVGAAVALALAFVNKWKVEPVDSESIILAAWSLAFLIAGWFPLFWARDAKYDSQFLYLKGSHGEEVIPLRNIDGILVDRQKTILTKNWFILYHNENGDNGAVRVITSSWAKREAFETVLHAANKEVEFVVESTSFRLGKRTKVAT